MAQKLTIARAKDMPFTDLVEEADAIVAEYSKPDFETPEDERERISRTLDEVPDVYRWFLTLQSWFGHWADAYSDQFGTRSTEFRSMRQRRDAMENAARAAKLRYEGASRRITLILDDQQAASLPRGR